MNCKRCKDPEELEWKQPYKKGDLPVRKIDGKSHICNQALMDKERMRPKKDVMRCAIHEEPLFPNNINGVCSKCKKSPCSILLN